MKEISLSLENWIIDFAEYTKNHEEWLQFMEFGMPTLEGHSDLLIELIINEARRLNEKEDIAGRTVSDDCVKIFFELGLTIQMADNE